MKNSFAVSLGRIFKFSFHIAGNVRSALDISEEEWDNTMKTNLTGAWLVSKSVCIRMRDAKIGGSIINISSIAGLHRGHLPGSAAYTASKVALNTLTKVLLYCYLTWATFPSIKQMSFLLFCHYHSNYFFFDEKIYINGAKKVQQ